MKTVCRFFLTLLALSPLSAFEQADPQIVVQNRIVAKVDDKAFSVLDVMKQMDMFISRNYPQMLDQPQERYSFYMTNWRYFLSQMVDSVLIVADSADKEMKLQESDIRSMIQERFGPHVLVNLEKIGLSLDEAREMIRNELIVQQMTWYRVNGHALQSVNPQDVKNAYLAYCKENPAIKEWKYQVLSLRANNPSIGLHLAEKATQLLETARTGLVAVAETLKHETKDHIATVSLSQEFESNETTISEAHKEVLLTLKEGEYSGPIPQKSRDQSIVYRIFHLKEENEKKPATFREMCAKLEDELIEKAIQKQSLNYIPKLRARNGITDKSLEEMIPKNFEPFSLSY